VVDNHRCLGKFNIDFIANANQRFPKEDRPIYNFIIDADVTDNGETHTQPAQSTGYNTMNLDITVPKKSTLKIKPLSRLTVKP
jgi:hypothetical protein